jgi:hypothetical protein
MLAGEAYARVLNASMFVPTCGTMAGEVVRKHFEIPGAGACLVTEHSAGLEAAGFADMENCVFADHRNVGERLDYLLAYPDARQRIATAGYNLVHARHTLQQRPQIYQWYRLQKDLQPGQKIIQNGPFGDLMKVDAVTGKASVQVVGVAPDRALLRQGDLLLAQNKVEEAKRCYSRCLDYVSYLPEAKFCLAICALQQGETDRAYTLLVDLVSVTVVDYQAAEPDPVEWAYFLLALVCKGQSGQALQLRDLYPRLAHDELRRARLVLELLGGNGAQASAFDTGKPRRSIHRIPDRSDNQWLAWFATVLEHCQQPECARMICPIPPAPNGKSEPVSLSARKRTRAGWRAGFYANFDTLMVKMHLDGLRPNVPPLPEFRYFWVLARGMVPASHRGSLRRIRTTIARLTS